MKPMICATFYLRNGITIETSVAYPDNYTDENLKAISNNIRNSVGKEGVINFGKYTILAADISACEIV